MCEWEWQPRATLELWQSCCGEAAGHLYCFCFESCYLAGLCSDASRKTGNRGVEWCLCVLVCECRLVLLSAQCQGGVNGLSVISGAQLVYANKHNSNSTPANCKACICLLMPLQSKKSSGIWIYTRTMLVPHIVVRWTISLDAHMPAIIRHWRLFWIQWSPLLSLCGQIFLPFRKLLRAADQAAKTRKVQMNHLFGHLYQEIVSALSMKVKTSFNVNSQHVPEEDLC